MDEVQRFSMSDLEAGFICDVIDSTVRESPSCFYLFSQAFILAMMKKHLLESPRGKKESPAFFALLLVWWSVLCSAPKDRLCVSSPMQQHVNLHLQASVCLLDDDGFLMLSILFFIQPFLDLARFARSQNALGQQDKGVPPVIRAKKRKSNKTSIHGMKDDERQRGKMTQS